MIKLVAFDWNGTLLADTDIILKACNLNFKEYGLKPISKKVYRDTFSIPVLPFWLKHGGKAEDLPKQAVSFHKIYESLVNESKLRPGAKTLLDWLEKNRIKQMIYSNHVAPDIIKQLLRLNIFEYFDEILARPAGDHSQVHTRSKEQKLYDYIKRNRLKPKEILTIGDTEEEIQIGKKAGLYTVAITGGDNSTPRLKKHKPDFLIDNMLELKKIIQKLNKICLRACREAKFYVLDSARTIKL